MTDRRICFDFALTFSNGGGLQGQDFRLDLDGDDLSDADLAAFIIRDLRLLMVDTVTILNKRIILERHKRATHAAATAAATVPGRRLHDLTCPTGRTMLRAPDGSVGATADLDAVVIRLRGMGKQAITMTSLAATDVTGKAVLLDTGIDAPILADDAVTWLIAQQAALVGMDGPLPDGPTALWAAGIPTVSPLKGLDALPVTGLRFSAVPTHPANTPCPVRAWARETTPET